MIRHRNSIGLVRLILASSVIIGHAPEILDGDRHREPLTQLFHTLSLGECAVDGFFLLSGYLITGSMLRTQKLFPFLCNRAARIYPAFIVCYFICVAMLAPILGQYPWNDLAPTLINLVFLKAPPSYPSLLHQLHHNSLNGAMWSISYEFKCYLLVAFLWQTKVLYHRRLMLLITIASLIAALSAQYGLIPGSMDRLIPKGDWLLGSPAVFIRLFSTFALGVTSYLYKDELLVLLSGKMSAFLVPLLVILMFYKNFAELSLILLGGYCLLWISLVADMGKLQRINDSWDISYGMYLYGWPAAIYLIYLWPTVSPSELAIASLALAMLAGLVSWWTVEKWTKDPFKALRGPTAFKGVGSVLGD